MERSDNDYCFVKKDDELIGVCLGASFCAEHEWGINRIISSFGMNTKKPGYEGLKNSIFPDTLVYLEQDTAALIFTNYHTSEKGLERIIREKLRIREGEELGCAWDGNSFGINTTLENKQVLKSLYNAFSKKKGVITMSPRKFIENSGLTLINYSKIPKNLRKESRKKDKEHRKQQKFFRKLEKKSGVYELLKQGGKSFMSLRIHRLDENGEPMWWLNPYEQDKHNYGWFKTQDLEDWANNKGPIMKE